jgi:hypothetical protein
MKNLLLILSLTITLCCCHKDDDQPIIINNPISQLPPATQTGANTAGCLVNNIPLTPKGTGIILNCFYQDALNFGLGFSMNMNGVDKVINISSLNQPLVEGQIYQLKEYGANSKFGEYSIDAVPAPSPNHYSTTTTIVGELKITHHDFGNAILSGTFWFDAINSNGEKVQVREGRFDMHY